MQPSVWDRLRYHVDNVMAKGTVSLVALLFAFSWLVIFVAAGVAALAGDKPFLSAIWVAFNRVLDPGYLENDRGTASYVAVLIVCTLCGVLVTSILIGLVTAGLENKLAGLRKGRSRVLEKGHVVVLGFNEATFTILQELIDSYANYRRRVVVVMDNVAKDEMDDLIRQRIPDTKTTKVICRTGQLDLPSDLAICSLAAAQSIIVNTADDFVAVKAVLAASSILEAEPKSRAYITAVLRDAGHLRAAKLAGRHRAEIVPFQRTIARIIAHACRQPGVSEVFTDLFDTKGHEFYAERIAGLEGVTLAEANRRLPHSTVVGVVRQGLSQVNPPPDTIIRREDLLILLAADDGISQPLAVPAPVDEAAFAEEHIPHEEPERLLVLGSSPLLADVLAEQDLYLDPGSVVVVADPDEDERDELPPAGTLRRITVDFRQADITDEAVLEELLDDRPDSVLILADSSLPPDEADARSLLLLLMLREIAERTGRQFAMTSEMNSVENQALADVSQANDFVVSSHLTSLIMTQIAQTRALAPVFTELLDAAGSEIYLKPAARYVRPGVEVDLYTAGAAVAALGGVFLGYRTPNADGTDLVVTLNPPKSERRSFGDGDVFIVLAEG
jgi:Trk K+ transport system NAD-binding subunit